MPSPTVYPHPAPDRRPPLVLLHGFCEDASVWNDWLAAGPLAPTLTIDLPGFGSSPLPSAPADLADYAAAVKEALDERNLSQCVLVGHSLGGYVALEFAQKYPERLAGLGLFHSHPFEDTDDRKEARRRGIELLHSGKRDLYVAQLFPNLFETNYKVEHPEVLGKLIAHGQTQPTEGIVAALEAMIGRRNHTLTLAGLNCPALFLLGKEDTLVPLEDTLAVAASTPVSEVQVLSGVAHMGMFEAPERTREIVRNFWERSAGRMSI